jgi:hypothetical protein
MSYSAFKFVSRKETSAQLRHFYIKIKPFVWYFSNSYLSKKIEFWKLGRIPNVEK